MTHLIKIISVSLLFFLNVLISILSDFKAFIASLIYYFYFILVLLYHFGEEKLIKSTLSTIPYPNTIALILNQQASSHFIVRSLINFIRWSKYAKIKHLIIYDPFNILSSDKIKSLCKILEDNFTESYLMGICHGEYAYNLKEKKEVNHQEMLSYGFDMILTIIDFKSANNSLMGQLSSSDEKNYASAMQLGYYKNLHSNKQKSNLAPAATYEKYYTRKKATGLPEVVLTFDKNEICLFGFPFSLLENSEIIATNSSIVSFDVLKFIRVFSKNSAIQKRFGV